MAFSSSSLAIEQLTFEADDTRCSDQNISSFESLVSFESEFPKKPATLKDNLLGALNRPVEKRETKPLKELKLFEQNERLDQHNDHLIPFDKEEQEQVNSGLDNVQESSPSPSSSLLVNNHELDGNQAASSPQQSESSVNLSNNIIEIII